MRYPKETVEIDFASGCNVRIADIHVWNREGPLCLPRTKEQRIFCVLWFV